MAMVKATKETSSSTLDPWRKEGVWMTSAVEIPAPEQLTARSPRPVDLLCIKIPLNQLKQPIIALHSPISRSHPYRYAKEIVHPNKPKPYFSWNLIPPRPEHDVSRRFRPRTIRARYSFNRFSY